MTTCTPTGRVLRHVFRVTRKGQDGALFSDTVEVGGLTPDEARAAALATWPDIVELRHLHACSEVPAAVRTAARRLRYLRRYPEPHSYQVSAEPVRLGMSYAYGHALRVLIDEFGLQDDFHALYYGPQGEDADLQAPL